jgi:hypothetical protein
MITHRTHLNPMVNVALYHLFAYFVKEKRLYFARPVRCSRL